MSKTVSLQTTGWLQTRYDRCMMNETAVTNYDEETLYEAIEHALSNVIGHDDIDTDVIQSVADRVAHVLEKCDEDELEDELVQTSELLDESFDADLWDEVELNDYVCELVTQLEEYEVL